MNWPDEISTGFPSPRDGEPADLRRDIADELADHLDCATEREMAGAPDAEAARRAALERFGSPTRLARQLWTDAMKEAIMKDRILLGTVVLLALGVIALAATTWTVMRQNQETNRAMLAAIQGIADRTTEPAVSSDLATLTVRAFKDREGGAPLEGMALDLIGEAFSESKDDYIKGVTDSEGKATFGPVRAGRYSLAAVSRELPTLSTRRHVTLYAGGEAETAIVPPALTQPDVHLVADWPDDLLNEDLRLALRIESAVDRWQFHNQNLYYVLSPDGRVTNVHSLKMTTYRSRISEPGRPAEYVALLACELLIYDVWLARADEETVPEGDTEPEIASITRVRLPDSPDTRFTVQADGPNEWRIPIPESIWEAAREDRDLRAAKALLGWTDPGILSTFEGQLVGVVPIEKHCSVARGHDVPRGQLFLADGAGGALRTLLQWQSIPAELAQPGDRRFLLALFSRETTPGQPLGAPLMLQAHEITERWPEKPFWESPAFDPDAALLRPFEIGKGWKTFDITDLVRGAERENRQSHGVLLRFQWETSEIDASLYEFQTRWATNPPDRPYRPVLLVIEPKSEEKD